MRALAVLLMLALLAACAAPPKPPVPAHCTQPDQSRPVDGGLGGTGNRPPEGCPDPAEN